MSLNCQSINAKINNLRTFCEQCNSQNCNFDIIALQETWLQSDCNYHRPTLSLNGYNFIYSDRRITQHGGLGFYINTDIEYKIRPDLDLKSNVFETLKALYNDFCSI